MSEDTRRFKYAFIMEEVLDDDGSTYWAATVPDLPGCCAVGNTVEDCLDLLEKAIQAWLESHEERGLGTPEPSDTFMWVIIKAKDFVDKRRLWEIRDAIEAGKKVRIVED